MKSIAMFGYLRDGVGKAATKRLRIEGKVPCVLYGPNVHTHFAMYSADFKLLVYTPNAYKIKLDIDGKMQQAILKDIQFHPVNDSIVHADFLEIHDDREVEMYIPVRVKGTAIGVKNGGKLHIKARKVLVKCLPAHLPDFIEIVVDDIDIGKSVKVGDLKVPNVKFLDAAINPVVSVKITRAVEEEVPAAGTVAAVPGATPAAPGTPGAPAVTAEPAKEEKGKDKGKDKDKKK